MVKTSRGERAILWQGSKTFLHPIARFAAHFIRYKKGLETVRLTVYRHIAVRGRLLHVNDLLRARKGCDIMESKKFLKASWESAQTSRATLLFLNREGRGGVVYAGQAIHPSFAGS